VRARAVGTVTWVAWLAVVAAPAAADSVRVVPLVRATEVLVSMELADGFTDEVRAIVHSGLRTTFTYTVELRLAVPFWIDQTVATATVATSVQFDNLTRRYTLMRTIDGRVADVLVTEDEARVRDALTTFTRLPLFSTAGLEANREYYVRVRAQLSPRKSGFVWPWASGPTGQVKFTFIP
jgi:hypothetical protein